MRNLFRLLFAILLSATPAFAAEPGYWPQWRGPTGQGYATDDKVPLEWSATKNLLWKTKLPGFGHSTPVIWGDRAFLTCATRDGSERRVVCVNTNNGKIVWDKLASKSGPERKTHESSNHATASCVTDGKSVYAFFGTPGLYCYDLNGTLIWHHQFGVFTSKTGWGFGASPILFDDLVIQNCDNDGSDGLPPGSDPKTAARESLIALNKVTGRVVWETPRNQGQGWSTPVLIAAPGGRVDLVLNGQLGVWGYDPKTGKELWHCERYPELDNNKFGEPLPLFSADTVYAAAGRNGGFLQAVRLGGQGDISKSGLIWEVSRKSPRGRDVGSGILAGDYLIFADGRGAAISAHDVKTGKQLFSKVSPGAKGDKGFYSSPLMLNGKVLCLRMDGTTFVVDPGPELKIVGENVLSDGTDFSASPAVAGGKLFLRSQTHLYCIGEKK